MKMSNMWTYGNLKFDFEHLRMYYYPTEGKVLPGAPFMSMVHLMIVNDLIMLNKYNLDVPEPIFSNAYENGLLQEAYGYYLLDKHVLKGNV